MTALPQFARFWMVCRKPSHANSKTEPRRRYSHLADARDVATRLAASEDAPHIILEAVEIIRPTDKNEGLPL